MSDTDIGERFKAYVTHRLSDARDIRVDGVEQIFGGASRETYRFDLGYRLGGETISQGVVLRRDPESGAGLIDTQANTEYLAYDAFYGTAVPVPRVLWLEEDTQWLGRPFFAMEEITGCEASLPSLFNPDLDPVREKMGETFCRILGKIAAEDPAELGLLDHFDAPALDGCWKRELDYWESFIDENELEPQPIVRAAIRRLRRYPPPPAQKISLVHADYRAGNFLYDKSGRIHAILDWEQAHLGDPVEDLCWALNPLWSWGEPEKIGRLVHRDRAIDLWQEESGLTLEPDALHWWEIFSSVKGMGIWISSGRKFADGKNTDPILGFAAWQPGDIQIRVLLESMGRDT